MSGDRSLPTALPLNAEALVDDLDKTIPHATITSPEQLSEEGRRILAFEAGRRSVVDELIRLKDEQQEYYQWQIPYP